MNINDGLKTSYSEDHSILKVGTSEHMSTFSAEYTATAGVITETDVITPSSGNHLVVYGVYIATEAAAGTLLVDFDAGGEILYKAYLAKETAPPPIGQHREGAADDGINITGAGLGSTDSVTVIINYAEHNGS